MKLGWFLWLIALIIGVLVGINKYGAVDVPTVTEFLNKDVAATLLVATGLGVLAKIF